MLYRRLLTLETDLSEMHMLLPNDILITGRGGNVKNNTEDETNENRLTNLSDLKTSHFRYVGEAHRAEAFFENFGDGHFARPLLQLRTQYHKLDISIKSDGSRGAMEKIS